MLFPVLAACFGTTQTTTLQVPQTFPTIQAAIDAAQTGDEVLVHAGTYLENIDFHGKAITVRGGAGPQVTIIDGGGLGPVVWFHTGERKRSVLTGFTITGGQADYGAGIFCDFASPTIEGNVFDANSALGGGGAVYCQSSSPIIAGNRFTYNHAAFVGGGAIACDPASYAIIRGNTFAFNSSPVGFGGAILCDSSTGSALQTVISDNTFADNSASVAGAIACSGSAPLITRNVFLRNVAWYGEGGAIYCHIATPMIDSNLLIENRADTWSGGAIACFQSSPTIRNNTLFGNDAAISGGGLYSHDQSLPVVTSSILWQNTAQTFEQIFGDAVVSSSDVQGGWFGPGNLDIDPLFVDAAQGDCSLKPESPCVDVGDDASDASLDLVSNPRRLDGDLTGIATVDMGAYEFGRVHLTVTGSPTPGGTLVLHTTGDTKLTLALLIGTARGEIWFSPFGPIYLRFDRPWLWVRGSWSDQALPIPSDIIGPIPIVLQQLAFDLVTETGNSSNAVDVTIE